MTILENLNSPSYMKSAAAELLYVIEAVPSAWIFHGNSTAPPPRKINISWYHFTRSGIEGAHQYSDPGVDLFVSRNCQTRVIIMLYANT